MQKELWSQREAHPGASSPSHTQKRPQRRHTPRGPPHFPPTLSLSPWQPLPEAPVRPPPWSFLSLLALGKIPNLELMLIFQFCVSLIILEKHRFDSLTVLNLKYSFISKLSKNVNIGVKYIWCGVPLVQALDQNWFAWCIILSGPSAG